MVGVAQAVVVAVLEVVVEDAGVVVEDAAANNNRMINNVPDNIIFQWHLTDKCNRRCKHCYQNCYEDNSLSKNDLFQFLDQLCEFVNACRQKQPQLKAHINFTGGEPFLCENFLPLLQKVKTKNLFTYGILSNGYLWSADKLMELKHLNPKFIQISLEGNKITNDNIRGLGSYDEIVKALHTYRKYNIPVMISFTANVANYKSFPDVVRFARKHKAFKVWTDRYLPANKKDKLELSTEQTKEFFQIILNEQNKNKRKLFSKLNISSNRALQFLVSGGKPYKCSGGNSLLAILPNGDLLPCRRLPITIGNLKSDNIIDLYNNNETLKHLRQNEIVDSSCKNCFYTRECNGGLKCLTFAKNGLYTMKDPNCWL
ncbi:MAG: radical SAM protein [Carboxylicivirga sp.]|nr:radical SAM protein [Carboxylicivirga sp.]